MKSNTPFSAKSSSPSRLDESDNNFMDAKGIIEVLQSTKKISMETCAKFYDQCCSCLETGNADTKEKAIEAFTNLINNYPFPNDEILTRTVVAMISSCMSDELKDKTMASILALSESNEFVIKECLHSILNSKCDQDKIISALINLTNLSSNSVTKTFSVNYFSDVVFPLLKTKNEATQIAAFDYLKKVSEWENETVVKLLSEYDSECCEKFKLMNNNDKIITPVTIKVIEESYEEISVLKRFSNQWCNQLLASKRWKQKCDKLDELFKAISVDRIKYENFSELGKTLKILLEDSNNLVANITLKVIGQLAKGLRENLSSYAKNVFTLVVQHLKDKKVSAEAQRCLKNLTYSLKFEDNIEQIKEALNEKLPIIKQNICNWLEFTIFNKVSMSTAVTMGKAFGPILVKMTDDASSEVREAALNCLGGIKAVIANEPSFTKIIKDLSKQKKERLDESCSRDRFDSETKESMNYRAETTPGYNSVKSFASPAIMNCKTRESKGKLSTKPYNKSVRTSQSSIDFIQLDDSISVISPEDATKSVYGNIPPIILAQFDIPNSKAKLEGINELHNWIKENSEKAQELVEAIIIWLKRKVDNFKENDDETMANCFNLLKTFCELCIMSKGFAHEIIPPLVEKMTEEKWHEDCITVICLISDSVNPAYVSTLIVKSCHLSKYNSITKGGLMVLIKMAEEYDINLLPLKVTVEYAGYCLENRNAGIMGKALQYISLVYSRAGNSVKSLLPNDLNKTTHKILQDELAKVKYDPIHEMKRNIRGETAKLVGQGKPSVNDFNLQIDISAKINSKLISSLSDPSTKVRQETKDELEKMLVSCNNHIASTGLELLMSALKERIFDSSKILAKSFIALIANFAVAMGKGFCQYCNEVIQPLLSCLADKQIAIKAEIIKAIDKIINVVGIELIMEDIGTALKKGNCETRNELLTWLIKNGKILDKCDNTILLKHILVVTNDKSNLIRNLGEKVMKRIIHKIGYHEFEKCIKNEQGIKGYEDILMKFNPNRQCYSKNMFISPMRSSSIKKGVRFIQSKVNCNYSRPELNSSIIGHSAVYKSDCKVKSMSTSNSTSDLNAELEVKPKSKLAEFKKASGRLSRSKNCLHNRTVISSSVVLESGLNNTSESKEKHNTSHQAVRLQNDRNEKLKQTFKEVFNQELVNDMFSTQIKSNLSAIRKLIDSLNDDFKTMIELIDPLLKWITIKLQNQTSVLIKDLFEFLTSLYAKMVKEKRFMSDIEANTILPALCEKLFLTGELKTKLNNLLNLSTQLYSPMKVCNFLISTLGINKNRKTKIECLILVKDLSKRYGLSKKFGAKDIKLFAKLVISIDSSLKDESMSILLEIYKARGDSMWKIIDNIPEHAKINMMKTFNGSSTARGITKSIVRPTTPTLGPDKILEFNERSGRINRKALNKIPVENNKPRPGSSAKYRNYAPVGENLKSSCVKPMTSVKRSIEQENKPKNEFKSLDNALEVLMHGTISRRVESLMYLNEKICSSLIEEEKCLISHSNQLLQTFSEVINEIFGGTPESIPIRFAKYFMTIVNQVCSNKLIVAEANEKSFSVFAEQLLTKLLYEGLEKVGENKEGEYLVKAFNSIMLKILEYYDPTKSFIILLDLFKRYNNTAANKENKTDSKLTGLITKCLLKMTNIIYSAIDYIDAAKILLSLHECLVFNPVKGTTDDMAVRMSKTIVYELVNAKGESIWNDYKPIELSEHPDTQIKMWIDLILKSTHPVSSSPPKFSENNFDTNHVKNIFQTLSSRLSFQEGIKELSKFISDYPEVDLSPYFSRYTKSFRDHVLSALDEYRENEFEDVLTFDDKKLFQEISDMNEEAVLTDYENQINHLNEKSNDKNGVKYKKSNLILENV